MKKEGMGNSLALRLEKVLEGASPANNQERPEGGLNASVLGGLGRIWESHDSTGEG